VETFFSFVIQYDTFLAACVILNTTFNHCIADSRVRQVLNLKIIGVASVATSAASCPQRLATPACNYIDYTRHYNVREVAALTRRIHYLP
jgi:hypothetical protein